MSWIGQAVVSGFAGGMGSQAHLQPPRYCRRDWNSSLGARQPCRISLQQLNGVEISHLADRRDGRGAALDESAEHQSECHEGGLHFFEYVIASSRSPPSAVRAFPRG